jgi:hypothetical protein
MDKNHPQTGKTTIEEGARLLFECANKKHHIEDAELKHLSKQLSEALKKIRKTGRY